MSGGANGDLRQAKLNFAPPSQTDKTKTPQVIISGTNNDVNTTGKQSKRGRTDFEDPGTTDDTSDDSRPTSESDNSHHSLFNSDSTGTVIDRTDHEMEHANPRESVLQSNEQDHRPRLVRLERLHDKADRYSSHIGFLKECKDYRFFRFCKGCLK